MAGPSAVAKLSKPVLRGALIKQVNGWGLLVSYFANGYKIIAADPVRHKHDTDIIFLGV